MSEIAEIEAELGGRCEWVLTLVEGVVEVKERNPVGVLLATDDGRVMTVEVVWDADESAWSVICKALDADNAPRVFDFGDTVMVTL